MRRGKDERRCERREEKRRPDEEIRWIGGETVRKEEEREDERIDEGRLRKSR